MAVGIAERSLERLSVERGDVTVEVMKRFYHAFPDARASFIHHGLSDIAVLEGRMVAESAFLLLQWSENPQTARIDHGTAVPHHNDTLKVGPHWYLGMVDAFLTLLYETIPADAEEERSHWEKVRFEIVTFFGSLRDEFLMPDDNEELPKSLDISRFC